MALHFTVRVNGEPIGGVVIKRLYPRNDRRKVYWYAVSASYRGQEYAARCDHRYTDGALVLIRKALQAIERQGDERRHRGERDRGGAVLPRAGADREDLDPPLLDHPGLVTRKAEVSPEGID